MKLDDRPVIEQLLNPKPANLLHEEEWRQRALVESFVEAMEARL